MKISNKIVLPLAAFTLLAGAATTIALQTHAATSTIPATSDIQSQSGTAVADPVDSNDPADTTAQTRPHGHAPLGGDGNITAINGTSITMQEESDEVGAAYTIDATNATVTNNGSVATLSDLKVGDKIFVQGTTTGTNVVATSVSLGHPEMGGKDGLHK